VYYLTPSEAREADVGSASGWPGLVVDDSHVPRRRRAFHFEVTDGVATVPVRFDGRAPDALDDGAEAVSEGRLGPDGVFEADTVLARCASRFEAELEP
jgi:cytochrome c-type biogenesis protein CcmE